MMWGLVSVWASALFLCPYIIYTIVKTLGVWGREPHGKGEYDGGLGAGDVGMIMAGEVADISPASGGWGE